MIEKKYRVSHDLDKVTKEDLEKLWCSVYWGTDNIELELKAVKAAPSGVCAWDKSTGELAGLCTAITDGFNVWIAYLVVRGVYQLKGIGSYLVARVLDNFDHRNHRFIVNTTNAAEFYRKMGFIQIESSCLIWEDF